MKARFKYLDKIEIDDNADYSITIFIRLRDKRTIKHVVNPYDRYEEGKNESVIIETGNMCQELQYPDMGLRLEVLTYLKESFGIQ